MLIAPSLEGVAAWYLPQPSCIILACHPNLDLYYSEFGRIIFVRHEIILRTEHSIILHTHAYKVLRRFIDKTSFGHTPYVTTLICPTFPVRASIERCPSHAFYTTAVVVVVNDTT